MAVNNINENHPVISIPTTIPLSKGLQQAFTLLAGFNRPMVKIILPNRGISESAEYVSRFLGKETRVHAVGKPAGDIPATYQAAEEILLYAETAARYVHLKDSVEGCVIRIFRSQDLGEWLARLGAPERLDELMEAIDDQPCTACGLTGYHQFLCPQVGHS